MAKKDTASKIMRSLEAEKQNFKKRLENADSALSNGRDDVAAEGSADKVIRDTFSMPNAEYELIAKIKERCLEKKVVVSKSQVVRAGLALLEAVSDRQLLDVINKLTKVKAGRPVARRAAAR